MKTIITTSLLALAIAACGGAGTTTAPATEPPATASPAATTPASAEPSTATEGQVIVVKDFTIEPLDVVSGTAVALAVTNEGPTPHNLTIRQDDGDPLAATEDLREGASQTLTADLEPGSYILFCSLPGHESLGMKGTLTIE